MKSQSSQKTRVLKIFCENSPMPIDSGRSVLEEINTMEGFGIGSKVVKPVSNYERDGLTDGSCAVTRTLDRRKNRDEITRELGQPPSLSLCIYALPHSSRLQVIAMCTRHTPLNIPLTPINRAHESTSRMCASFPFGRCLFT